MLRGPTRAAMKDFSAHRVNSFTSSEPVFPKFPHLILTSRTRGGWTTGILILLPSVLASSIHEKRSTPGE